MPGAPDPKSGVSANFTTLAEARDFKAVSKIPCVF